MEWIFQIIFQRNVYLPIHTDIQVFTHLSIHWFVYRYDRALPVFGAISRFPGHCGPLGVVAEAFEI